MEKSEEEPGSLARHQERFPFFATCLNSRVNVGRMACLLCGRTRHESLLWEIKKANKSGWRQDRVWGRQTSRGEGGEREECRDLTGRRQRPNERENGVRGERGIAVSERRVQTIRVPRELPDGRTFC